MAGVLDAARGAEPVAEPLKVTLVHLARTQGPPGGGLVAHLVQNASRAVSQGRTTVPYSSAHVGIAQRDSFQPGHVPSVGP